MIELAYSSRLRTFSLCFLALLALLACGCRSTRVPESKRAAAVVLTNCAPAQITAATKTVFEAHDYESAKARGADLVFQKPGGFMKSFLFGDWYSGPVWRRVRVYVQPLDTSRTLLDCDVYLVQEPEDPMFQKETKTRGKDSDCQKLLNEVAASLSPK